MNRKVHHFDDGRIVVGDITKPGHDYICKLCAELFEVRYGRDEKPVAVLCPICGTGRTNKIISVPALRIWWKDALSSEDASRMAPRFQKAVQNRAARRRD